MGCYQSRRGRNRRDEPRRQKKGRKGRHPHRRSARAPTEFPRALVLEVVPEHRLVVAVGVVPGEVVETVVPQLIARSEQVSQRRAGGVAATGGLDGDGSGTTTGCVVVPGSLEGGGGSLAGMHALLEKTNKTLTDSPATRSCMHPYRALRVMVGQARHTRCHCGGSSGGSPALSVRSHYTTKQRARFRGGWTMFQARP